MNEKSDTEAWQGMGWGNMANPWTGWAAVRVERKEIEHHIHK